MSGLRRERVKRVGGPASCVMAALLFASCTAAGAQGSPGTSRSPQSTSSAFRSLSAKATAARDGGNLDEAVPLYHQALVLNPRWDEGWWSLGEIDYGKNRYREAAGEYRKAAALDPKSGIARIMLGLCEFELGQDAAALRDIEAGKDLGVENDQQLRQVVFYHEAILLQRAGRFEAATEPLSSLCLSGVRGQDLAAVFGMTMLHINSKTPPAEDTPEGDVVQHIGRGACLSAANEYNQARLEYEYVLQKYPHFPLVHYAWGRFLLDTRDRPGAIEAFQQEIAEQPNSVLARLEIAATDYKVDSAAGIPYARQALEIAPQSPLPHYFLGLLLLDTGDYQDSILHLEAAKKAFPWDAKIYWSLGVAYAHVGRPKDAAAARADFARINQNNTGSQRVGAGDTPGSIPRIDVMDKPGGNSSH